MRKNEPHNAEVVAWISVLFMTAPIVEFCMLMKITIPRIIERIDRGL